MSTNPQPTLWDDPDDIWNDEVDELSESDSASEILEVSDSHLSQDLDQLTDASNDFVFTVTDLDSVEVRRSARRKRSVSAFRENGKTIVVVPQRMSQKDIKEYVRELVGRLDLREQRAASTSELLERARRLSLQYLDRDVIAQHPVPVIIKWVTNQNTRWGSCTPRDGNIRISHRVRDMPEYVIDCIVLHEIIHLIELHHNAHFYAYMDRYPELERAKAYLAGYTHAARAED